MKNVDLSKHRAGRTSFTFLQTHILVGILLPVQWYVCSLPIQVFILIFHISLSKFRSDFQIHWNLLESHGKLVILGGTRKVSHGFSHGFFAGATTRHDPRICQRSASARRAACPSPMRSWWWGVRWWEFDQQTWRFLWQRSPPYAHHPKYPWFMVDPWFIDVIDWTVDRRVQTVCFIYGMYTIMRDYHSLNITNESRHDTARLLEHTHTQILWCFCQTGMIACMHLGAPYQAFTLWLEFWFIRMVIFPSADRYQQDISLGMLPQCSEQPWLSDHSFFMHVWGNHYILIKQQAQTRPGFAFPLSTDWFQGKTAGKPHISWENRWFPVSIFPQKPNPLTHIDTTSEFSQSPQGPSPGDAAHGGRGKLALGVPTRAPARVFLRISTRGSFHGEKNGG